MPSYLGDSRIIRGTSKLYFIEKTEAFSFSEQKADISDVSLPVLGVL